MGKKAKKAAALKSNSPAGKTFSRRKIGAFLIGALVLVLSAAGINAYETNHKEMHDLQVIGQGTPVIVQIHDPGCPTCRRLKSVVTNTLDPEESVLYRLADITTAEGKALQTKHGVPHVTLLFFNDQGKHVHTTQGLQSTEQLRAAINAHLLPPHS